MPSRLIAKIYLFRTIFRGSGWSFANDPDFMHVSSDPAFWDNVNEKFFKKYAGLNKQHHIWKDLVLSGKPIEGPLGDTWFIPVERGWNGEIRIPWTLLSNYPVQGTGASIMMIARISFWRRFRAMGLHKTPCKLVSTVHDSIVVDCPDEYIQIIVNLFHQVFDDLPANFQKLFGYKWEVPLDCECKFGQNMRDMVKVTRNDV